MKFAHPGMVDKRSRLLKVARALPPPTGRGCVCISAQKGPHEAQRHLIMNDSLRRDTSMLWRAPALEATRPRGRALYPHAPSTNCPAEAMLFDRYYIASYPTVPNRTDV